ncbi:hypothetical protein [Sphingomonas sp.]|uniref:hypothetical protein n=1 Tax=Sphingomonas sp. TaxID=28214 RepID=UPI002DD6AD6F|nr:hypothetical protein [Sphingomonas sp.]
MIRALVTAALLAAPLPAAAQTGNDGTYAQPIDMRTEGMRRQRFMSPPPFNVRPVGHDCWQVGCLTVFNETQDYVLTGLFLDTALPGTRPDPVWSPNLLRRKVGPRNVVWSLKLGDDTMCDLAARVELQHRKTGERIVEFGEMSLCKSPRIDSVFRIRTPEPGKLVPRVIVEQPA